MTRLPAPDPATVPEDLREFLAQFPPDEMFTMLTHSPSTAKAFIGLASALHLAGPAGSKRSSHRSIAHRHRCR